MSLLCRTSECINFLSKNDIEYLDASDCLHMEGVSIYFEMKVNYLMSEILSALVTRHLGLCKVLGEDRQK